MRSLYLLAALFGTVHILASSSAAQSVRDRVSFNENWRFQKDDPRGVEGLLSYPTIKDWVRSTGNEFVLTSTAVKSPRPSGNLGEKVAYTRADFNDSSWRRLNLPHDWAIEGDFVQELRAGTGKRPFEGVGWYRKTFSIAQQDKGKQIYIDFDGAMAYSTVWLNGQFVGGWPYGYTSFRLDLTPYVKFGAENLLAVRLENLPESSRWYPGAGIYRNVWMVKTAPVHVGQWGTYVTTPEVSRERATVAIRTTVRNDSRSNANALVRTSIFENGTKRSKPVATTEKSAIEVAAGSSAIQESTVPIKLPKLWSVSIPSLYVAVTEIEVNGRIVDKYQTVFGIRSVEFDAEKGFLLNGERLYM
ncbi:MAG: sugar-binding domain-containing protein, partial [Pyrinomonadaceae bacterium]